MVLVLTFQWHLGSTHTEESWLRREKERSFLHNDTRRVDILLYDGEDQATGFHYESSFSICPFILRCLDISGWACVIPLPWLYQCVLMAIRRDRLCIVLGCAACQLSWMALAEFFASDLSVSQLFWVQSVRSLAATSNHTLISLEQKKKSTPLWRIFHNIRIKTHLSPDVDHPGSAVSVWGVSSQWYEYLKV